FPTRRDQGQAYLDARLRGHDVEELASGRPISSVMPAQAGIHVTSRSSRTNSVRSGLNSLLHQGHDLD
ncbi:MAG: hypothetical protein NW223_04310, partial [Hyphomicrobiaceae bacterium]|nr:hypothetical protein [Hyphomicrobiaceae bacterium]